jgi:hypothetical protein
MADPILFSLFVLLAAVLGFFAGYAGRIWVEPGGYFVVKRRSGIGSAGRPAKSRWCKSITMKE